LEKDRERRFATANSLAADVRHYLHDEPVPACPPSVWYRLRKHARRNRAALATIVLVAAVLLTTVVALVISNISISRKEKEKSEALVDKNVALDAANASRHQAEANLTLILVARNNSAPCAVRSLDGRDIQRFGICFRPPCSPD
jgi:hypothetical protein